MSMGIFNIGQNSVMRDMFNTPDEKDFKLPASQTQATPQELKILRTRADGSAAFVQRAAPDLLEGMDASIYNKARGLLPPSVVNQQTDVNFMPDRQRLGQLDPKVLQDTMLAKTQALAESMQRNTSLLSADKAASNNFIKAKDLVNDLNVSALKPDAKRNVALALKPILESFRNTFVNELKVLSSEISASQKAKLEAIKLGDYKDLQPKEIQYVEKFQRLQYTDEQLGSIEKLIQVPAQ